ncbi:hypothetical protein PHYPSEUDO_002371 [Phytophthora pseudosyringae]|uniref:Uncharacterized protein n=1 Tax=Phytophthora pseudosyringae TaxID=221518 RepID=A0A8T1VWQ9_9STRA|nr:hypothetical protein PHYPSEUDO_002371 [Phytophthora pseudosyringae]
MAVHNDKKCRRCSCRNVACQRRKADQRRQAKCLIPHAQKQLLLILGARALRRRQHLSARKEPPLEMDEELGPDEVAVDGEDLQVMRDSVDKMQRQFSRGLRDIQEIRALVEQAAAQRELERREMNTPTASTGARNATA